MFTCLSVAISFDLGGISASGGDSAVVQDQLLNDHVLSVAISFDLGGISASGGDSTVVHDQFMNDHVLIRCTLF